MQRQQNQTSLSQRKAIKTGSVPQKVNHPHKRTSGQSIANHVGPHCPLSIFIPHNQDYEAMLKTKRNVTRKLVIYKSSTHMARTSSTIFTHKNSIAGSIVKHKYKHNQTSFSRRKAIKTGSVPQKVNHPHKRTSGQSIANHVGPHCPLSIFIPHNQDYEAMLKTKRNVTRKLVMHRSQVKHTHGAYQ